MVRLFKRPNTGMRASDPPPKKIGGQPAGTYSEDLIHASHVQISRMCRCSGMSGADAEDLEQDLWLWLLRAHVPITLVETSWFVGVVHNYILRYRRRMHVHHFREGRPLENAPEPRSPEPLPVFESNDLLNRISAILPRPERNLMDLIRSGHSLAEASRMLGIPKGSRDYYRGHLIAYARRALRRNKRLARP